jgi:hypothetical protein
MLLVIWVVTSCCIGALIRSRLLSWLTYPLMTTRPIRLAALLGIHAGTMEPDLFFAGIPRAPVRLRKILSADDLRHRRARGDVIVPYQGQQLWGIGLDGRLVDALVRTGPTGAPA